MRVLAAEWGGKIAGLFGRAPNRVTEKMLAFLAEHVSRECVPSELEWQAICRMHAARKKNGAGEDRRLGVKWLESADLLAELLPEAADRALTWVRETLGSAEAMPVKKERPADPPGWPAWLAEHYPRAAAKAFADAPEDIRAEFQREKGAA